MLLLLWNYIFGSITSENTSENENTNENTSGNIWVDYQWKAFLPHVRTEVRLGVLKPYLAYNVIISRYCNGIIKTLDAVEYRIVTIRFKIWWIKLL